MSSDFYGNMLRGIVGALQGAGLQPSIRGENAARFVYVEQGNRAAELSLDEVRFFVELFEEPHVEPLKSYLCDRVEQATDDVIQWVGRIGPVATPD